MIIEIRDVAVLKLLTDKQTIAAKSIDLIKQMEEIEKETNKNAGLVKRIDEKVRPKISKLLPNLGEFEQLSRVYCDKDGKWKMEIVDRLEQFKTNYKKAVNE